MRELPVIMRVLAAFAVLVAVGCGDDDADGGGSSGSGGGGARPDGGGVSGNGGSGAEAEEGSACTDRDPCAQDLVCAGSPITINGTPVGVCGLPCDDDSVCDGGQCITYTGDGADAHCVNIVDEEYEFCGVADTSLCSDDLTCLYLPRLPVGVCVRLCALGGGASSGDEEDGGVASGDCSASQTCIEGVIADPTGDEGVCGTIAARGEECGIDIGLYCADGDICAPDRPDDENSPFTCHQDCSTADAVCEEGSACVLVQGMYAYCTAT